MRGGLVVSSLFVVLAAGGGPGWAKTVFAPGGDPVLDQKMSAHTRMFYVFNTAPFGIGLTAEYGADADLALIRQFLAQDLSDDPVAVVGKTAFDLVSAYEGGQGIGLRGGGAVPGTAFRYMALKAEGAAPAVLASARRDVVRAIEATHVNYVITGVKGRMARGVQRLHMDDGTSVPGTIPQLTPLFDDKGNPLPPEKTNDTSRADNSHGLLPAGMWIWEDSCSKDQLDGWVAAMATLYDAANGDPDIDQSLVERMRQEAAEVGAMLREKHKMTALDGQDYEYDLVIMDGDGRPTLHNDLNPLSIDAAYTPPDFGTVNVFNLIMAVGIVKGLYHVSGDPAAEAFLYGDLLGKRGYLGKMAGAVDPGSVDYIYMGVKTNYSNVNMIAIALFLNLWFESDPQVLAATRDFMEARWWDVKGLKQTARLSREPYYHALYLAMTDKGTDTALAAEAASLLKAYRLDPYVSEARVNCDDDELAKKSCLAIDGKTTLTIQDEPNRGGWPVATEALDPSIRPPSNFDARTDPFEVNGGGGNGLNPGGDLHAAYWLLRYLPVQVAGTAARSQFARTHMPAGGWPPVAEEVTPDLPAAVDAAEPGAQLPATPSGGSSGGCATGRPPSAGFSAVLLLVLLAAAGRSRRA